MDTIKNLVITITIFMVAFLAYDGLATVYLLGFVSDSWCIVWLTVMEVTFLYANGLAARRLLACDQNIKLVYNMKGD